MPPRPPPPPPRPPFCEDASHDETTVKIRANDTGEDGQGMTYQPHTAPHVGGGTRIRVSLGDLVKWGAAVITVTLWAWTLWSDVQRLKEDTREMRTESKQMAADVAAIKRVVMPPAYASATQEAPRLVLPKSSVPENE